MLLKDLSPRKIKTIFFFNLYSYFVTEKCIIVISCVRNKVILTYLLYLLK